MNSKKRWFVLLGVLALCLMTATSALANSVVTDYADRYTGTFTGSEPTYIPQLCGSPDPGNYAVIGPLVPTVSGDYAYVDLSIGYDLDIEVNVYENSFDPTNPTVNLISSMDDNSYATLTAGTSYYYVVSDLCGDVVTGTWDFALAGPSKLSGSSDYSFRTTFTGSEPTFDSEDNGSDTAYVAFCGTVSATGMYYYGDIGYGGVGDDMELEIYEGSFDPSNPFANYLGVWDDRGDVALTAGVKYFFVFELYDGGTGAGDLEFVLLGNNGRVTLGCSEPPGFVGTYDVWLSGEPSVQNAAVGDTVTWEFVISNLDEEHHTYGLGFRGDVPEGLQIDSVTVTQGVGEARPLEDGTVWVDIENIAPEGWATIEIETTVLDATEVCVTGAVVELVREVCVNGYPGQLPLTGMPSLLWEMIR